MRMRLIFGILLFLIVVPLSAQQVKRRDPLSYGRGENDRGYDYKWTSSFIYI